MRGDEGCSGGGRVLSGRVGRSVTLCLGEAAEAAELGTTPAEYFALGSERKGVERPSCNIGHPVLLLVQGLNSGGSKIVQPALH